MIASAGDVDNVNWLKNDLKFDYVFNYKKVGYSRMNDYVLIEKIQFL